ncbi:hypothetical protein LXL04_026055 [Taraxacum kok-saghyz]
MMASGKEAVVPKAVGIDIVDAGGQRSDDPDFFKGRMAYGKMMEALVNCHCYENADAATGSQPSEKEIEENHREKNEAAERESAATIPEPVNLI